MIEIMMKITRSHANTCHSAFIYIYKSNIYFFFYYRLGSRSLIDSTTYSGILVPGVQWHTLTHHGTVASVTYRVRVVCDEHYYNTTCNKLCRPRNDQFGHYSCDASGDKVCVQGWMGATCEKRKYPFRPVTYIITLLRKFYIS